MYPTLYIKRVWSKLVIPSQQKRERRRKTKTKKNGTLEDRQAGRHKLGVSIAGVSSNLYCQLFAVKSLKCSMSAAIPESSCIPGKLSDHRAGAKTSTLLFSC